MHHGLACCPRALTTDAVRPAAEEERPEVYTARGRKAATYLSSCDLAQEGSPTIATFMSPRRLMPCMHSRTSCAAARASNLCHLATLNYGEILASILTAHVEAAHHSSFHASLVWTAGSIQRTRKHAGSSSIKQHYSCQSAQAAHIAASHIFLHQELTPRWSACERRPAA